MYSLSTDTVKSGALASTLLCAEAMRAMHQTRASQVPSNTYTFHQAMILKIIIILGRRCLFRSVVAAV